MSSKLNTLLKATAVSTTLVASVVGADELPTCTDEQFDSGTTLSSPIGSFFEELHLVESDGQGAYEAVCAATMMQSFRAGSACGLAQSPGQSDEDYQKAIKEHCGSASYEHIDPNLVSTFK